MDTTLLLVLHGLAGRPNMPVDIENSRHLTLQVLGFIQQGCAVESWNDFITQFANAVALSRERTGFFESRRSVHPFLRPAVEHNFLQQTLTQPLGFSSPLLCARGCRGLGCFSEQILFHLKHRYWGGL